METKLSVKTCHKKCDICGKVLSNNRHLQAHLMIHTGEKPFECKHCGQFFRLHSTLVSHERTHTGEKPFQCKFCHKYFRQLAHLSGHLKTHTGEKSFSCTFCNKKFTSSTSKINHERSHTGEKPFHCDICWKTFATRYLLRAHKMKEHSSPSKIHPFKERTLNRDVRGKSFCKCKECFGKKRPDKQLKIHTTCEKPFECSHCGKFFLFRSSLVSHERSHTGEKPFSCQFCDRKFASTGTKRSHERIHTGEKPYYCEICGKTFSQACSLKAHKTSGVHSDIRRFKCDFCGKGFYSKGSRRKHLICCKLKNRGALTGQSGKEKALLDSKLSTDDGVEENSFYDENDNPYKLKHCSVHLRKLWYIERALDLGCTTIWIPPKGNSSRFKNPKFIQ